MQPCPYPRLRIENRRAGDKLHRRAPSRGDTRAVRDHAHADEGALRVGAGERHRQARARAMPHRTHDRAINRYRREHAAVHAERSEQR